MGADHFFVTCHDVGVRAFEGLPFIIKNSIRVVCSLSYNAGYIPHKDVALPQILQPFALPAGGNDIENRSKCIIVLNKMLKMPLVFFFKKMETGQYLVFGLAIAIPK